MKEEMDQDIRHLIDEMVASGEMEDCREEYISYFELAREPE